MNIFKRYILIIEDEKDIAEFIADEFQEEGFQVVMADNLKDALFKSNNQQFELILSDIQLKSGSGEDLIKHIKTNSKHINYKTPIVVTSAWLTKNLIHQVGQGIAYAFVKPFEIKQVMEKCLELVKSNEEIESI
ncbi:response regulator [Bacteriovorax sp. DB6_IX]|uniref:response regulator n=1 Tax=Bacteriovorax sp. DB6_IX TaxID=1353530 RepID=UPI00038A19B4|nr:response regulator [Bacteriovorax sp. DB6_IX]EQC43128.1 response regulator receiver domain protein [Bacteriovorax sp. DB6_IX]